MSRTSGSCTKRVPPQVSHRSGALLPTTGTQPGAMRSTSASRDSLQPAQYQAGIWCPHQICRDTHQSLMFSIQAKYEFFHASGMMRVRPSRTASMAGSAKGLIFTNHWGVR